MSIIFSPSEWFCPCLNACAFFVLWMEDRPGGGESPGRRCPTRSRPGLWQGQEWISPAHGLHGGGVARWGLGLEGVCLAWPGVRGFFPLCRRNFITLSPGDFESTLIKAGGSEAKRAEERATGESPVGLLWLSRDVRGKG